MNFTTLADYVLSFSSRYPYAVAAIAVILLFIVYRKPKESFKFVVFLLFMAAVFYALSLFRDTLSTGTQNAHEGIQKSTNLKE